MDNLPWQADYLGLIHHFEVLCQYIQGLGGEYRLYDYLWGRIWIPGIDSYPCCKYVELIVQIPIWSTIEEVNRVSMHSDVTADPVSTLTYNSQVL